MKAVLLAGGLGARLAEEAEQSGLAPWKTWN